MKILFLTLGRIDNIEDRGIYHDLFRKFRDEGHDVNIVCPNERKYKKGTSFTVQNRVSILNVWITNIQKTNLIEKAFTTIFIEYFFLIAIKKFYKNKKFDFIIYTTPPITFTNLVNWLKKTSSAKTYLLLKDIFPQNAVDLNIINKRNIIYKYFRNKEIQLYRISDFIGCMSVENKKYLLINNPYLDPNKIEINPNSIEVINPNITDSNKINLSIKYKIPTNKIIFIFGGNLGLPQGIEFIKKNIDYCKNLDEVYFLIVGDGTEFNNLKNWIKNCGVNNTMLIKEVPKVDFDQLISISDVGLIFLNNLFTIPNFPSRILTYMQYKLPVLCATDSITDIGKIAKQNNFGFNCNISDLESFYNLVVKLMNKKLREKMGTNAYEYLKNEYDVRTTYNKIIEKLNHAN